ncbi:MAG: MotA/TolQ/ExbB proton channel family protein [Nitrospinota bacterium]
MKNLITVVLIIVLTSSTAYGADFLIGNSTAVMLFFKGGIIMWPILASSLIAVAIVFERLFSLRRSKVIDHQFLDTIPNIIHEVGINNAIDYTEESKTVIARIIRAGLLQCRHGILEVEQAILNTGSHEATLLQSNLRALGALANLTPMLGLLGTVIGMIKAFDVISLAGTGNPGIVAAGISEALITTAAGLIIGIFSLAAYHVFRGKVDKLVFEMEQASLSIITELNLSLENNNNPEVESDKIVL